MRFRRLFYLLLLTAITFTGAGFNTYAQDTNTSEPAKKEAHKTIDVSRVIFGDVADAHEWHFFSLGETRIALPLPVILYNTQKGLSVFSSSKITEGGSYDGYRLDKTTPMKEKIVSEDGSKFYDLSITKNVLSMIVSVILLLWIMIKAGKKYNSEGAMKAPSGFQNALEAIVIFIRDEVAKPCLGHKYKKYMPLLLTIFFFVWINNLLGLGLLPVGINFTGNIAVTCCLAIISFVVMIASSNKHFWSHLLNPPNVPFLIKCLLVPIEIVSLFIKPMALMVRLFANMLAGHIVIISLVCMVFIFGALNKIAGIGFIPVSIGFSVVMFLLELLVGAIQAFIFANLTAVFIGQAIEENHSEETGQEYHVSPDEAMM